MCRGSPELHRYFTGHRIEISDPSDPIGTKQFTHVVLSWIRPSIDQSLLPPPPHPSWTLHRVREGSRPHDLLPSPPQRPWPTDVPEPGDPRAAQGSPSAAHRPAMDIQTARTS